MESNVIHSLFLKLLCDSFFSCWRQLSASYCESIVIWRCWWNCDGKRDGKCLRSIDCVCVRQTIFWFQSRVKNSKLLRSVVFDKIDFLLFRSSLVSTSYFHSKHRARFPHYSDHTTKTILSFSFIERACWFYIFFVLTFVKLSATALISPALRKAKFAFKKYRSNQKFMIRPERNEIMSTPSEKKETSATESLIR